MKIAVVGSGIMGNGIAQVFAMNGYIEESIKHNFYLK
jgi:3-hydroxyacyl-CoA dehydrogenase